MKKTVSTVFLAVLLVLSVVMMTACGGNSIQGSWAVEEFSGSYNGDNLVDSLVLFMRYSSVNGIRITGDKIEVLYNDINGKEHTDTYRYTLDGTAMKTSVNLPSLSFTPDVKCEMRGGKLVLSHDGAQIVLRRK